MRFTERVGELDDGRTGIVPLRRVSAEHFTQLKREFRDRRQSRAILADPRPGAIGHSAVLQRAEGAPATREAPAHPGLAAGTRAVRQGPAVLRGAP